MRDPSPNSDNEFASYVAQITELQRDLYAYILTLLPRNSDADDVLQETNRVLWSKREEFEAGTNFRAWAYTIARYQILAHCKRHQQDRMTFDERLLQTMASEVHAATDRRPRMRASLEHCMGKLSAKDAELIDLRYRDGLVTGQISQRLHRSAGAIRQALFRVRHALLECLQRQMRVEGEA